ncbi:hypothetical protein [Gracilimonas sp.]
MDDEMVSVERATFEEVLVHDDDFVNWHFLRKREKSCFHSSGK